MTPCLVNTAKPRLLESIEFTLVKFWVPVFKERSLRIFSNPGTTSKDKSFNKIKEMEKLIGKQTVELTVLKNLELLKLTKGLSMNSENQVWAFNLTLILTSEVAFLLLTIIDCFTRKVFS